MKKPLIALALALFLFSCDNGDVEKQEQETGPFSLIGTWEAEGEYVVPMMGNDQRTYKSTLTFLSETEFTEIIHYKSKQGTFDFTSENEGTYTLEDEKIVYTYSYKSSDGSSGGPFRNWTAPFKIINKNTLETNMFIPAEYVKSMTYKRKS